VAGPALAVIDANTKEAAAIDLLEGQRALDDAIDVMLKPTE
jgi:hypothetical protein